MNWKELLRSTWVFDIARKLRTPMHYKRWLRANCPHPPPGFVKHRILQEYAKRFPCDVFVETGTFRGNTVSAMSRYFGEIHSIELNPVLASRAQRIFKSDPHITIHQGDSSVILKDVLQQIGKKSVMFWLDGHYYAGVDKLVEDESPIIGELEAIRQSGVDPVVVLVDDVREFDGTRGYLSIDGLKAELDGLAKGRQFYHLDDIFRWHL